MPGPPAPHGVPDWMEAAYAGVRQESVGMAGKRAQKKRGRLCCGVIIPAPDGPGGQSLNFVSVYMRLTSVSQTGAAKTKPMVDMLMASEAYSSSAP